MFNFFNALTGGGAAPVNLADAVQEVAAKRALLVDVREPDELRSGKGQGALNLPLGRLHMTADPASGHFDRTLAAAKAANLPIYLYCASGARSGRAAGILRRHGFTQVHNLGSLSAWARAGGPVQR